MSFLLIGIFLAAAVVIIVVGAAAMRQDKVKLPDVPPPSPASSATAAKKSAARSGVLRETDATRQVEMECFKLSFSVGHVEDRIVGEHKLVLKAVADALEESVNERDYFPRRPMQLPKLLQALKDNESTRKELVRLILEDPTLAGAVLQRANNAFYRVSPEAVENIDRAVTLLGIEGLRGLMAAAIMQPVFRVPRGCFEKFAGLTWEQAERMSMAADKFARHSSGIDPFIAQLLGLVSMLANIVLFRLTMDKYRDHPAVEPDAAVFISVIQAHRGRMAQLIAQSWGLAETSLKALQEQRDDISPEQMTPLGGGVYFGTLCGSLATLAAHGRYSETEARALLTAQGLDAEIGSTLWTAASSIKAA